ncbi:hypothetical protein [Paenibacillus ginsengarvi]|nr:hypothetical protein [Paenibacillus ginsengarvi]
MSTKRAGTQDSPAQRRQAEQNEEGRAKKDSVADKKLGGPNRPSV